MKNRILFAGLLLVSVHVMYSGEGVQELSKFFDPFAQNNQLTYIPDKLDFFLNEFNSPEFKTAAEKVGVDGLIKLSDKFKSLDGYNKLFDRAGQFKSKNEADRVGYAYSALKAMALLYVGLFDKLFEIEENPKEFEKILKKIGVNSILAIERFLLDVISPKLELHRGSFKDLVNRSISNIDIFLGYLNYQRS